MRITYCAIGVLISFVFSQRLPAATLLIDGLTQGSLNYSATGPNTVNGANETGVDTINGMRASSIDHVDGAGTATVTLNTGGPLTVTGTSEVLSLGYGATYIGGGMESSPELHADLSATQAMKVTFGPGTPSVYAQLFLETDHGGGVFGEIDDNGHGIVYPGGSGNLTIPFSSLTGSFGGGVDFTKIDSIFLTLQTQAPFTVTQISAVTVPEPITLVPMALLTMLRRQNR